MEIKIKIDLQWKEYCRIKNSNYCPLLVANLNGICNCVYFRTRLQIDKKTGEPMRCKQCLAHDKKKK